MTDRPRNLIVGTTTLAGLVGLGVLLFLFGYVPAFLSGGYDLTLDMPDAVELNEGSDVKLSGITVGQVKRIAFKPGDEQGVLVSVFIRDGIRVPKGSVAEVDTDLLGGTATVRLVPQANYRVGEAVSYLPEDGSAVIPGDLGSLAGAFASLDQLTSSIENLSSEWSSVGENVNALLDPRGMAVPQQDYAPGRGPNLVNIVADINARLAQIETVVDEVRAYTGDAELRADVKATVANVRATSEAANARFNEVADRVLRLADSAAVAVDNANDVILMAKAGEGSLGKILTDPAIFDNFADTATRISMMADEATLMIQKFKEEGVPIRF